MDERFGYFIAVVELIIIVSLVLVMMSGGFYDVKQITKYEPIFVNNELSYIIDIETDLNFNLAEGKIYFTDSDYFSYKRFASGEKILYFVPIKYFGKIFPKGELK